MKNNLSIALFAGILVFSGCGGLGSGSSAASYTVKYEVKARWFEQLGGKVERMDWGFANLTYENETGGTEQLSNVRVPWTKTFNANAGAVLYISAQNNTGIEFTFVTVNIYVNDVLVKTAESKGAYVVATASGRL